MAAADTLGDVEIDATHVTFLGFATAAVALVVANAYGTVTGNAQWLLTDWLISYDAGFVRRGITGTLLWPLAQWVDPAVAVAAIHVVGYGIVTAAVVRIVLHLQPVPWQAWPVMFAPFLLTYPIFDPSGAYRKDTLYLAVFAAVAASTSGRAAIVGTWAMVPIVLAHEALVVFVPYLLAVGAGRWDRRELAHGLAAAAVVTAFAAAAILTTNSGAVTATCAQIASLYPDVTCGTGNDAVGMMHLSASEGMANTARRLDAMVPSAIQVAALVALGIVPAVAAIWGSIKRRTTIVVLVAGALAATVPVAAVASDWGRFLYLHALSMGLIVLISIRNAPDRPISPRWRTIAALATVVYSVGWSINYNNDLLGRGIFG